MCVEIEFHIDGAANVLSPYGISRAVIVQDLVVGFTIIILSHLPPTDDRCSIGVAHRLVDIVGYDAWHIEMNNLAHGVGALVETAIDRVVGCCTFFIVL